MSVLSFYRESNARWMEGMRAFLILLLAVPPAGAEKFRDPEDGAPVDAFADSTGPLANLA